MQLPDVNLDAISDPATREVVRQLLNIIEAQATDIAALRAENQHLRDEVAHLKGGSGKPAIKPSVKPSPADHSSEAERQTRTPRGKPKKNQTLTVTREQRCVLDPATLPPDARFNGTREYIAQNLIFQVEVIRFLRDEWFVPSTNQTILAPLPPGYRGGFSPSIQTIVPALGHDTSNVSQPALLHFLRTMGVSIGAGTVARLLADATGRWAEEADAIHLAGLASGPWVATDQTSTRVDGRNEVCHVVGNPLFTSYHTRPGGTRQDVLSVLWGQELRFRLNAEALAWLEKTSLPATLCTRLLAALPWERDLTRAELCEQLSVAALKLGPQQLQQVGDALALAAYHAQTSVPIVEWLLSDDATVYDHLSNGHGLCWVHDWRHYAKLRPVVASHLRELQSYRTKYWELYRGLARYRLSPSEAERTRLRAAFDTLVEHKTDYDALGERMSKTADKREQLLAVLELPDLPLHNNDMELGARRRVRKRDVSFGPQSRTGARAWDTFQTIAATAAKLGVGLYHYLLDRLVSPDTTPSLAERIAERSLIAAQPAG
jgi:Transposase IS66 family